MNWAFNMKEQMAQSANVLFLVLDALRYDAAQDLFLAGKLPNFSRYLPQTGWEKRYTPASFTYPAHQAFFTGFLPTRISQGITPRHFAAEFKGSESTTSQTYRFQEANILAALHKIGYQTVCVGGVGFFNKQTALSRILPDLFQESFWSPELGVTDPYSTQNQFNLAAQWLDSNDSPFFLYINVSAIHQPNCHYLNATEDSLESHQAALAYVDQQLPILMDAIQTKGPVCCFICSDHGTAYGEDGHWGHRNGHRTVMEVPYIDFLLA
ncbi:MAG: STM4013/SEN3800 family hydrolase [Saprospiraceae bacterium]|nr:STM4013/SEN3800 family hydrolase [Saprospiraceae bacterium]